MNMRQGLLAGMDNRKHARMDVRIRAVASTQSGLLEGSILDVSPEGLFFCPDNPYFVVNDNVNLNFDIPGKPTIQAVIKWKGHSKNHDIGGVGCSGRL